MCLGLCITSRFVCASVDFGYGFSCATLGALGLKLIWKLPVDLFQAEIASVKASLEKAKIVEGSA